MLILREVPFTEWKTMLKGRYVISTHVRLDHQAKHDDGVVIANSLTGSRIRVSKDTIALLELFKRPTPIATAIRRAGAASTEQKQSPSGLRPAVF